MEGRRFVKGLLSKAESLLSKIVSSLWDGAESDSIPKAKPFHCCWRVPSAYGNEPIPYQLTFSDGGRSRDPLPSFETHDHLCPLPALACRGIYFFRTGTEVMPWLVHTRKIRALSSLSASKGGGSLKSRQLISKCPGYISSACTYAFTCWQALATSSQGWLFWIDCKAILQLKNTMCQDRLQKHRRAALNILQSWQYNRITKDPPSSPSETQLRFLCSSQ